TVHSKTHNKEIAESLWGLDAEGRTWEYMFFIKEGKSISLPYKPEVLEYKPNHIVQGALLLSDEKAEAFKEYIEKNEGTTFNETDVEPSEEEEAVFHRKIKDPATVEEAESEIERVANEIKDQPVREKIKVAKMLVRNPKFARLVKERVKYICEICGVKPFMQKNGLPYAEAHHKSELAKTKIDNPKDMICVCPTCHKVIHFGTNDELLLRTKM
ncbi:MAG: HNH endonuclease, partial [Nitrosopumilus sp.]|nr:HNH endonuclease [Nitrosopumilus sp.]